MTLRPMTSADLPAVEKLEQLCFSDPWTSESLTGFVESPAATCLCACKGDELVGYIFLLDGLDFADIANVAVSPDHRRQGIASALLAEACRLFPHCPLLLEVRASNVSAQAFYEVSGFVRIGIRRGYYQHPSEDAYLYQKDPEQV